MGASTRKVLLELLVVLLMGCPTVLSGVRINRTDDACVSQGGTVCMQRPVEDCRVKTSKDISLNQRTVIDPLAFMRSTLLMDHSKQPHPTRHLKLQWKLELPDIRPNIFVLVTSLPHRNRSNGFAVCMSTRDVGDGDVTSLKESNDENFVSTLVPIADNVTSFIVEVISNNERVQYWVEAPAHAENSWILPVVSITAVHDMAVVSISTHDTVYKPHLAYIVTLMECASKVNDDPEAETDMLLSSWNFRRSDWWGFGNCSSIDHEVTLAYDKMSKMALVRKLEEGREYQLWIDAVLTDRHFQPSVKTTMRTPTFGLPHGSIQKTDTDSQRLLSDTAGNTETKHPASKFTARALPSVNNDEDNPDSIAKTDPDNQQTLPVIVVMSVVAAASTILVVVVVGFVCKRRGWQTCTTKTTITSTSSLSSSTSCGQSGQSTDMPTSDTNEEGRSVLDMSTETVALQFKNQHKINTDVKSESSSRTYYGESDRSAKYLSQHCLLLQDDLANVKDKDIEQQQYLLQDNLETISEFGQSGQAMCESGKTAFELRNKPFSHFQRPWSHPPHKPPRSFSRIKVNERLLSTPTVEGPSFGSCITLQFGEEDDEEQNIRTGNESKRRHSVHDPHTKHKPLSEYIKHSDGPGIASPGASNYTDPEMQIPMNYSLIFTKGTSQHSLSR